MANNYDRTRLRAAIAQAWDDPGVLHLRDVLKREYDEAQKRPRNEALEKWGPIIDEEMQRDLAAMRKKTQPELSKPCNQPKRDGPDMDKD